MASGEPSTHIARWAGCNHMPKTMNYHSAYAELYQREGMSGESYDRSLANRFELTIFRLESAILKDIFRRLRSSDPEMAYLDYACGTGRIISLFGDLIRTKVGVDTSAGQLAIARQKAPDAEFLQGNVVTNPDLLGSRRFDLVTAFRLLLNLEPQNRAPILGALADRLAQDGYLVVDNHMNRHSVLGMAALFANKVLGIPKKPVMQPGRRGIISTMSEFEMRRVLAEAGLEAVEVHRIFVLPGHNHLQLLPTRWLVSVETLLSRVPGLNRMAKNQIYVCRRIQPPR